MKHDKLIESWDKILPDEAADARMRSKIMAYQREHTKKGKVISMTKAMKMVIPVAACLALAVTGTAYLGMRNQWFGARGTSEPQSTADSHKTVAGGEEAGVFSVACFPASRTADEVADAHVTGVTAADAAKLGGLCDYLPTAVPSGYQWETAGLYETEMKDGTVYRTLKITYSSFTAEVGDDCASVAAADMGGNFYLTVSDFKLGTGEAIPADSVNASVLSDKWDDGVFCIGYGDYYVTLEPTSLTQNEALTVIQSIGK